MENDIQMFSSQTAKVLKYLVYKDAYLKENEGLAEEFFVSKWTNSFLILFGFIWLHSNHILLSLKRTNIMG